MQDKVLEEFKKENLMSTRTGFEELRDVIIALSIEKATRAANNLIAQGTDLLEVIEKSLSWAFVVHRREP